MFINRISIANNVQCSPKYSTRRRVKYSPEQSLTFCFDHNMLPKWIMAGNQLVSKLWVSLYSTDIQQYLPPLDFWRNTIHCCPDKCAPDRYPVRWQCLSA